MPMTISRQHKILGFTLLEVMVTVVILALGMMGLGALIIRGQQSTREAFERQSALFYAQFMAEKIRSNLVAPGHAPIALGGVPVKAQPNMEYVANDVGNGKFKGGTIAQNDLQQWDLLLRGLRTDGTPTPPATGSGAPAGGAAPALTVAAPPVRGCIMDVTPERSVEKGAGLIGSQAWINQPENPPIETKILQIFQVSVVWQAPATSLVGAVGIKNCAGLVTGFDAGAPLREISILVTKY